MKDVEVWLAIIGCYVAIGTGIFGTAIWVMSRQRQLRGDVMEEIQSLAKQLSHLATLVRIHHEEASIHGRTDHLVTNQLCDERIKRIEASLNALTEMLKEALRGISKALNGKRNNVHE